MIKSFTGIYKFLSNFESCTIAVDGHLYHSVEHAYQAGKTLDPMEQEKIRKATSAAKAKALGKKVKLRPKWDEIKLVFMYSLLQKKFVGELAYRLIDTGSVDLIEGNYWHDNYWGICSCKNCGNDGENHLGFMLMRLRKELKDGMDKSKSK